MDDSIKPLRLDAFAPDFETQLHNRLLWDPEVDASITSVVSGILADVRTRGDVAVLELTRQHDQLPAEDVQDLIIEREELARAAKDIPKTQMEALQAAASRVAEYHERQLAAGAETWSHQDEDGTSVGQKITPLRRVGIYVPGGKAAYPSTVLMNAIPARVAGVQEVVMVVPTPDGQRNALVLAAAHLSGVQRVFTVGGAQAIAALAFGTQTIAKVDKIVGPGNAYVASAKKMVFGHVGIDMIAGPSEVVVLADGTAPADWVAMDLFSQAEHDPLAQSILVSPFASYLDAVQASMNRLIAEMPRSGIIQQSLADRGMFILARDMENGCAICNAIAPEHLEVACAEPERYEPLLTNAGAIFLGAYTNEALGDYCAGPNHVLPTSGTARFSSPLGVYDFQKRTSLIAVSARGANRLGAIAAELARSEGLHAHAHSADMRRGAAD